MGILSNIFGRSSNQEQERGWRVGGTEDFMTLIRVYFQAVMAANFGLRDMRALPDLRVFKQTLKVPTLNNRIGLGEKNRCKKMLSEIYGISDDFFKEIDGSIKRRCKNLNEMQTYLFQFQGFSQELMMLMGNVMSWKFRLPGFLKGTLRNLIKKAVADALQKAGSKQKAKATPVKKDSRAAKGRKHPCLSNTVRLLATVDDRVCLQCCDFGKKRA